MSTKIYDGAKLTVGIAKAYQLLLEAKPGALAIAQAEQNHIIADMVLDHLEEKGEECTPFAAYLKLTQMRREKADLMWMCGYDLGFEVAIIPRGSHCLAIPFAASKALLDWFAQLPFVEEYGYWNNSDRPSRITQRQWNSRKKAWDKAFRLRPAETCLNFQFTANDLLDFPQPDAWPALRAAAVARRAPTPTGPTEDVSRVPNLSDLGNR